MLATRGLGTKLSPRSLRVVIGRLECAHPVMPIATISKTTRLNFVDTLGSFKNLRIRWDASCTIDLCMPLLDEAP
jgi:hypothetical protein